MKYVSEINLHPLDPVEPLVFWLPQGRVTTSGYSAIKHRKTASMSGNI